MTGTNLNRLNVRHASVSDMPYLMSLERACATAAHWNDDRYRELLSFGERLVLVAEEKGKARGKTIGQPGPAILGFLVARQVAAEWELENIVVAPASRRLGIGKRLLDALVARAREAGGEAVFLEVRESNAAARKLYEKAGFGLTGRRKSYYCDPVEDAILYRKALE